VVVVVEETVADTVVPRSYAKAIVNKFRKSLLIDFSEMLRKSKEVTDLLQGSF